jgi:hypothetical protein
MNGQSDRDFGAFVVVENVVRSVDTLHPPASSLEEAQHFRPLMLFGLGMVVLPPDGPRRYSSGAAMRRVSPGWVRSCDCACTRTGRPQILMKPSAAEESNWSPFSYVASAAA